MLYEVITFVLAEGSGVPVALEALARDQGLFAGVACLLPPDSPAAFAGARNNFV